MILFSQFYYKVGKEKGSIFFQSLCEVAILHFCILVKKNGYLISCCGNIKKRMMCEAKKLIEKSRECHNHKPQPAKPRTRLNNLKTCLRFPCLCLNTIIDSIKLTVLL